MKIPKHSLTGQLILLLVIIYGFMPTISYANIQCDIDKLKPTEVRLTPITIYSTNLPGTSKNMYARGIRLDCSLANPQQNFGRLVFEMDPAARINAAYPEAFDTNLAGVGIKFEVTGNPGVCTMLDATKIVCTINPTPKVQRVHFVIRRNLFKTAAIQEFGPINIPQGYIKYYLENDGPGNAKNLPGILDAASGIVNKNGCTLNTPNLNFNLGEHQQNTFKGIGNTGQEITQPIILSCNPKTKYSLKVNETSTGVPGVIKLTQEPGVATGIGVQLLAGKNRAPIVLGSSQEMGTSMAGSKDLEQTINITARYYQTDTKVTPGSANASVTFTMTYE
ncbi:putative fimbrial subunit [Yersinia aldovae]|uniref:fimbrial protein n=1 Tax=Yersinia aldovae TaxID=29483 RepID=UPI0005DB9480|nr:fimbrial protein [Yersinia aldovae]CNJ26642.1 putative fimbrial subunit [Yersinia aldovae]